MVKDQTTQIDNLERRIVRLQRNLNWMCFVLVVILVCSIIIPIATLILFCGSSDREPKADFLWEPGMPWNRVRDGFRRKRLSPGHGGNRPKDEASQYGKGKVNRMYPFGEVSSRDSNSDTWSRLGGLASEVEGRIKNRAGRGGARTLGRFAGRRLPAVGEPGARAISGGGCGSWARRCKRSCR